MNFIKIIKFDFMNIIKNPMLLIVNTIFPFILIGVMGLVTSGSFGAGNVSSFDYNGITMMIFVAFLIAMTASNTFMEEKVKKGNTRIIYAPVSKVKIYLSKMISTYILGSISYSFICFLGQFIFHINFGGKNLVYIMLLINFAALFGTAFGIMCCCLLKSEEGANSVIPLVILVFVFFGGIFFPTASFGRMVEMISAISPVRWVTECAFQIIYDQNFHLFLPVMGMMLLLSAICIAICQITFKPEDYVA
ncbi:ABC transporter permease [Robinsoniella peoriensis]|uniref:ABC transporter permease n=1 Tax=Robinsoniella peoriensis TaxID=180332 RepID=UPI0036400201